jgi:hypothetical protein
MVESLIGQFAGAQFGELIQEHFKSQSKNEILAAFSQINNELGNKFHTIDFLPLLNIWHDASKNKVLFRGDCGKIFKQINDSFQEYVGQEYSISEDDLFNFFNLVVLNLAYNVHLDAQFKTHFFNSLAKKNFLQKLFLKKEEKFFYDLWEKDTQISNDFDPFEYCKIFPKQYFIWLYQDFGSNLSEIKTYCYKKHHIIGLAMHFSGKKLY